MKKHLRLYSVEEFVSADDWVEYLEVLLDTECWIDNGEIEYPAIKAEIAQFNGYKVRVFSRDHNPPHIHIYGEGVNAKIDLADCSVIDGKLSSRDFKKIRHWYDAGGKSISKQKWNELHYKQNQL